MLDTPANQARVGHETRGDETQQLYLAYNLLSAGVLLGIAFSKESPAYATTATPE